MNMIDPRQFLPPNFMLDPAVMEMFAKSAGILGQFPTGSTVTNGGGKMLNSNSFRISDILHSPAKSSNSESEARASSEECRSSPLRGSPSLHDDSLRGSSPSDESPGGGKKARKARTIFTDKQLQELENTFDKQKYLSVQDRMDLAQRMGLSDTQVKTWYQNRRTKWKRQAAVGMDLLSDAGNLAAVQHLIRANPFWAQYLGTNVAPNGSNPLMNGGPRPPFLPMGMHGMPGSLPCPNGSPSLAAAQAFGLNPFMFMQNMKCDLSLEKSDTPEKSTD